MHGIHRMRCWSHATPMLSACGYNVSLFWYGDGFKTEVLAYNGQWNKPIKIQDSVIEPALINLWPISEQEGRSLQRQSSRAQVSEQLSMNWCPQVDVLNRSQISAFTKLLLCSWAAQTRRNIFERLCTVDSGKREINQRIATLKVENKTDEKSSENHRTLSSPNQKTFTFDLRHKVSSHTFIVPTYEPIFTFSK